MRLIDYDAAVDRYYAEWGKMDICDGEQDRDWLKQCIDEAPTIDPKDLQPHGRWIIVEEKGYIDTFGNPSEYAECSHCSGKWRDAYDAKRFLHCCPYCGARMDEEEK